MQIYSSVIDWCRIYFHPRVLVVMLLGFSSGLPRLLVASTLGALLTDNGLDMAAIGLFAYVALPYSFNFLWAPLADRWQIPCLAPMLGARRAWILLTQLLLGCSIAGIGLFDPTESLLLIAALAVLTAFFSASQDIGVDAFRTQYLKPEQYGEGAAMAVFGYRLGMLAAGAGALYLAEFVSWQAAYFTMAGFMAVGIITILSVRTPQVEAREQNERAAAEPTITATDTPPVVLHELIVAPFQSFIERYAAGQWVWLLGFILFYRLSDGFIGYMTTPFMLDIGFSKSTIASVAKLFGFGATLGGMFVGGAMISRLGLFTSLWSFGLLQLLANLAYLSLAITGKQLSGLVIAITLDNFSGGMVTAAAIAFMMRLCADKHHTATHYALLASLASLGSMTLAGAAGYVAQHYGWATTFSLSAVLGLPCLWIFWRQRHMFSHLLKTEPRQLDIDVRD